MTKSGTSQNSIRSQTPASQIHRHGSKSKGLKCLIYKRRLSKNPHFPNADANKQTKFVEKAEDGHHSRNYVSPYP